jgi:serine/threonine protein kinase
MSDSPQDAKGIFLAALDVADPAERAALVQRLCGDDGALLQRVDDLLRAYGQSNGPLDKMAAALAPTQLGQPIREQVGSTIGPYKLMEQIGEGGFGLVFVAEQQQPIRRKVALKIIKPGMDTRDVIARFEAERQALALMDHPNIARVLDAGTTESGRPYFVMELVRGVPITDYCDQSQLTPAERLPLFVDVCNAVQHAHQKGIIHRDIKPSNVLVTLHDDRPVVKVIDFGVAKALHQPLTDRTIYTRYAQMIGTPLYMSPEQAQMSGLDIDTRSDIYSLGVLFYELLTGTTPLNKARLAQAAYDELLKIIREDDPPKPSLRLSQSGDALPSIAAQRKTEPAKLSKMFSGDLDWITMKALEKDRTRRYETANAFAADVLRYLNDEPVEASPPSASYRIRKFTRKHRGPVMALASIMAILVLGIGGTTWGLFRAQRAEQVADVSKQQAVQALAQATKDRDDKEAARKSEAEQRDRAERELAGRLLAPIAASDELSTVELHGFCDWSAIKENSLKRRVMEVAFETPEEALRVARRSDRAIQAWVGLSPTRRADAIRFLSAKQRNLAVDARIRVAAFWLALEMGSPDVPAWSEVCSYLDDSKTASIEHFDELIALISNRMGQLDPEPLVARCEKSTSLGTLNSICSIDFESRLSGDQTRRVAIAVLAAIEKSIRDSTPVDTAPLVISMTRMVPRLEPPELIHTEKVVIELVRKTPPYQVVELWKALAPQMSTESHRQAWDGLVSFAASQKGFRIQNQAEALCALAIRLPQVDANRTWDALVLMAQTKNEESYAGASDLMSALVPRVDAARTKLASETVAAMFEKSPIVGAQSLTSFAPHLEPADAERVWAAALKVILTREPNQPDPLQYAPAFSALAPRLPAARIEHSLRLVLAAVQQAKHADTMSRACGALEALSSRLDPMSAQRAWEALLGTPQAASVDWGMGGILNDDRTGVFVALRRRMQPAQLSSAAQKLIAGLESAPSSHLQAMTVLAPFVEASQAARVADILVSIGEQTKSDPALTAVHAALGALAPRLDAKRARRIWEMIVASMPDVRPRGLDAERKDWLKALAAQLDASQVEDLNKGLIALVERPTDLMRRDPTVDALLALGSRMGTKEAALAGRVLTTIVKNASDFGDWTTGVKGFRGLAGRPGFPPPAPIFETAMTTWLDLCASNTDQVDLDESVILAVSPRLLAKLLSHPGCVDTLRSSALSRFEDLVIYEGRPVFLKPEPPSTQQAPPGAAASESVPPTPADPLPPRRFRNLADVADWIQRNWPDFDLEMNCPATWRGSH